MSPRAMGGFLTRLVIEADLGRPHLVAPDVGTSAALFAAAAGLSPAQDEKKMEFPKPGPEHAQLQQFAGTWDAAIKAFMEPGKPPVEFKGVETITAPDRATLWAGVSWASPVPGGMSTTSTSSSPHCTSRSICSSALETIGPRQIIGVSSFTM